jgi:uncharacterized membrane protein
MVAMNTARLLKHLIAFPWWARRIFPEATRQDIAAAVAASERLHRGELRFAVEGALPLRALLRDLPPRARAIELFSRLRVWDTAENSGILIYLQLVDHDVEILADRGIAAKVPQAAWDALCRDLETAMRAGRCREGVLAAIETTTRLLVEHFPAAHDNPNELSDVPFVL